MKQPHWPTRVKSSVLKVNNHKPRQKARKPRQEARQRTSRSQAERNPMLQVRLPKALYTALQRMAKADYRSLADWMRVHLARMAQNGITFNGAAPLPQTADAVGQRHDPPHLTTRDKAAFSEFEDILGAQEPTEPPVRPSAEDPTGDQEREHAK